MGIYLNPRNDSFAETVSSEIYIDKTELIDYVNSVLGTEQKFICVSRPRRFGKSITAKMLSAYYCKECDSQEIFCNLKISSCESYEKYLNRYDVIFLNMQDFLSKSQNIDSMLASLQEKVLKELIKEYPEYQKEWESQQDLIDALLQLNADKGESFVFIIDEWDCVFRENKEDKDIDNLTKKYLDFLRALLKDKAYVKLAYMTGILPIKKYGTHSALNMFDEFSMTDQRNLAKFTGFTEDEVKEKCRAYGMNFEEMERWYDGYWSGEVALYNPKSVVDALRNKKIKNYWSITETYEALQVYIDMNYEGLKDDIIAMLGGSRCKVNVRTFTNDMVTFKQKDDIVTLLIHLGYLAYDETNEEVYIPNEELREEFYHAISVSGWNEVIKAIEDSKQLLENTLNRDEEAVARSLDEVHMDFTSILTYNNENALSCIVLMAYYSAKAEYNIIRELPTGKGFADIAFLPRKGSDKPAMIIELKWDKSVETAITQIKEKRYVGKLKDYKEILLVGINYDKNSKKHQCLIEEYHNS